MEKPIDPRYVQRPYRAPGGPLEFGYNGQSYVVVSDNTYGLVGTLGKNMLHVVAPENLIIVRRSLLEEGGGITRDKSILDPNLLRTLTLSVYMMSRRRDNYVGNDLIQLDWSEEPYGFGINIEGAKPISIIPLSKGQDIMLEVQRRRIPRIIE